MTNECVYCGLVIEGEAAIEEGNAFHGDCWDQAVLDEEREIASRVEMDWEQELRWMREDHEDMIFDMRRQEMKEGW